MSTAIMDRCPECEGCGRVTYGNHSTDAEPCRTCDGRGLVERQNGSSEVSS